MATCSTLVNAGCFPLCGFLRRLGVGLPLPSQMLCMPSVSYYVFGCIGYSQLGTDCEYDKPVTSLLPSGLWGSLANAGLLAHCSIAYMV